MKNEIRKLLNQKYILFILLGLLCVHIWSIAQTKDVVVFSEKKNTIYYQEYLIDYKGILTEETYRSVEKLNDDLKEAQNERIRLFDKIHSKSQLSDYEIKEIKHKLHSLNLQLDRKEAFDKIKEQVDYVNEDRNTREVIDPIGWKQLLRIDDINYFLVISLLLLNIPLFVMEYEFEMHNLTISTKLGKRHQFYRKCMLSVMLSISLILLYLF